MKYTITLFALSLLLTACSKTTSDADIRQKIAGTWMPTSSNTLTIRPDGSLQIVHTNATIDGLWQVDAGYLIMTMTNVTGSDPQTHVGQIARYKVDRIDDHDLVCHIDGQTSSLTAHKP